MSYCALIVKAAERIGSCESKAIALPIYRLGNWLSCQPRALKSIAKSAQLLTNFAASGRVRDLNVATAQRIRLTGRITPKHRRAEGDATNIDVRDWKSNPRATDASGDVGTLYEVSQAKFK